MGCHSSKSANSQENVVDPGQKRLSLSKDLKVSQKGSETAMRPDSGAALQGNIRDLFPDFANSQKSLLVFGMASEIQQKGFADKNVQKYSSGDDASKGPDTKDFKIGYACKKGLKPESPNQDDFCICITDKLCIFGVFDGHGPYGHEISSYTHETLPQTVVKHIRDQVDPAKALNNAFPETHDKCVADSDKLGFDCALSGTTATLALLEQERLFVANVGDSRAVLAKGPRGSSESKAQELTKDHKPDCEEEAKRIKDSGKGQVRRLEGDIPKRVFLKDRMYPGLAMTRSIGDTVGVDAGVISTPDVKNCGRIEPDWRFLLVCSDGVWEFIESQEAVDLVSRYLPDCQKAAEALASESWNRWIKEEGNVVDDITVILYSFDK